MFLQVDGLSRCCSTSDGRRKDLRQPEVEHLRLTSIRDEDVRRLDVAVDDPFQVRGVERVGDLDAKIEHGFNFQWLSGNPMPERLPLKQFHGDEASSIRFVNLMDRADVWVIQ
jgi:hypothetical protein